MKNKAALSILILLFAAFSAHAENLLLSLKPGKHGNTQIVKTADAVSVTAAASHGASFRVPIPAGTKQLFLSVRLEVDGVVRGAADWQNARMGMRFYDKNAKPTGPWPDVIGASGTRKETLFERVYNVPQGAVALKLEPWNYGTAGKAFFREIRLFALNEQNGADNLFLSTPYTKASGTTVSRGEDGVSVRISGSSGCTFRVPLLEKAKRMLLKFEMATDQVIPGSADWQNARTGLRFLDRNGKGVGPGPEVFSASGTTGFRRCVKLYDVPDGAAFLEVQPWNYGKSGSAEFRNMQLRALEGTETPVMDADSPSAPAAQLWDLNDAARRVTGTREEICLNGLWRFKPVLSVNEATAQPPKGSGWGWFKVPGSWPGNYGSLEVGRSQTIFLSPFAPKFDPLKLNQAWYLRTVKIPENWTDKRVELEVTLIQTCAQVFINGKPAGEFYYPGGSIDLTGSVKPGETVTLSLLVTARPDEAVKSVFMAPGRLTKTTGRLEHRGICGDMFLAAYPRTGNIRDVLIKTSVKNKTISCDTRLDNLQPGTYMLSASVMDRSSNVLKFESKPFQVNEKQKSLQLEFSTPWANPKLWDIDRPENLYTLHLSLNRDGKTIDELYPETFGFREFEVKGRNFLLNGTVLHLRSLIVDGTREGAAANALFTVQRKVRRARELGFNHLTGYDYNCAPGITGYLGDYYRESSRQGMLTSLTLPHGSQFGWKLDSPEVAARYKALAEYTVRRYQNLPGVVMYSMNHNAAGYYGDQNPQTIGRDIAEDELPADLRKCRAQSLIAERIVAGIDPTRVIYHHAGSIGKIHAVNCYLNWAPPQERSDWLELWEKDGTKPVMMSEWGLPHLASWSSMRGPTFIWSGPAKQCLWMDEFNAEFLGDQAYALDPLKIQMMRNEEQVLKRSESVFFGELLKGFGNNGRLNVIAQFAKENFQAFRIRGLSYLLPWDQVVLLKPAPGQPAQSGAWPGQFDNLKQPGIVPDVGGTHWDFMKDPFREFVPTLAGKDSLPYLRTITGWIAGKRGDLTDKSHTFRPGELIEKTLLTVSDLREAGTVHVVWSVPELQLSGEEQGEVRPGERLELPFSLRIPPATKHRKLTLNAEFRFPDGSGMKDSFVFDILPEPRLSLQSGIALFDPEGTAADLLKKLGLSFRLIKNEHEWKESELLVLGRNSMEKLPFGLNTALDEGRKVLILEQSPETLERLGFRWNIQGLRTVFSATPLLPDLHHWRGAATSLPPFMQQAPGEHSVPRLTRNGYTASHVWRAGNRNSVATVLIEKPSIGNFKPLLIGGFDLQYAPLLEYSFEQGTALFCQLDLSGRTEEDPEAENLLAALLEHLDRRQPLPSRPVFYDGNPEGRALLNRLKISVKDTPEAAAGDILVITSGADIRKARAAAEAGAQVFALALTKKELAELLPELPAQEGKFFSDLTKDLQKEPLFDGISNSELHWRIELPMTSFEPEDAGGRALRTLAVGKGRISALQTAPWLFPDVFRNRTTLRRQDFLIARLLHNMRAEHHASADFLSRGYRAVTRQNLLSGWRGIADPEKTGRASGFQLPGFSKMKNWRSITPGRSFEQQFRDLSAYDGWFWYRLNFSLDLPLSPETEYELDLGAVDDESWVWLNGEFLGEVTQKTHPDGYWALPRKFTLKGKQLRKTGNTLVVLCNDLRGEGGILGTPSIGLKAAPDGLYTDRNLMEDDPYRYYRW